MNQNGTKIRSFLVLSISLGFVLLLGVGVQSAQAGDLHMDGTLPPAVRPTPGLAGGGDAAGNGSSTVRKTVTNIFYHLRSPAETISAALAPALFILRIALYHWNRLMGGQIVYAGPNDGWCNLVVIENGDTQVWYGYLLEIEVAAGQVVQRGEVVGLSGGATPPTGNSTGAHFHEGIKRRDGTSYEWIDPLQFLDASEWLDIPCR